jgi:hypothetical protein
MQFESRDGHLCARFETDEEGQEHLFVYDHKGNLLDVLRKVMSSTTVKKPDGADGLPAHGQTIT